MKILKLLKLLWEDYIEAPVSNTGTIVFVSAGLFWADPYEKWDLITIGLIFSLSGRIGRN